MLVLEREGVRAVYQRTDHAQVNGLTYRFIGGRLTGRIVRDLDGGPRISTERDHALLHRTCELSTANDGNDGRG